MTETAIDVNADAPLEVTILDVGHGNSAVVRDGNQCAVIDAAPGKVVRAELKRVNCTRIEHLIVSHSDQDHAGGGINLLLDDRHSVGTLWFNPDGNKHTTNWRRFIQAAYQKHQNRMLDRTLNIHTEIGEKLSCGRAELEICHPSILMAGTGPTKHSAFGRLDANAMSVVVRIHLSGQPAVLLAADVETKGLRHMVQNGKELSAPVLVFPHHGGLPGAGEPRKFARELTELVQPELVVFSIFGGQRPMNPNPDIVLGVQEGAPGARIACTQLSLHCHRRDARVPESHLTDRPAAGRKNGRCCAGTMTISRSGEGLRYEPSPETHQAFVGGSVSAPLCRVELGLPKQRHSLVLPTPDPAGWDA